MSDRFRPLAFEQLVDWAARELETRQLPLRHPAGGVLHAARRPRVPHARPRRRPRHAVGRRGRTAHPAGPEHRRGVADGRPSHRAEDDPDARRARREQAVHRRHRRGLQRRVEPGAARPRVVRRVPPGVGARPRGAPDARVPRRAARRPLQHERRLQPRGDSAGPTSSGSSTRWPTPRRTCRRTSTSSPAASRPSARSTSLPGSPTPSRFPRCTAARPTRSRRSPGTCSRSAGSTLRSSATRRCSARSGSAGSSTTTSGSGTCRSPTRRSGTTWSTATPSRCSGACAPSPTPGGSTSD